MKTINHMLICLGSVLCTSLAQGQVVLEALEGNSFVPSARCLELVKDRNYGNGTHNFIYCAVQGPNGKKWLNLNLGAEYAKESSPHFNPEAVPTNNQDWKASGSLFQYGRKADGHELITSYSLSWGQWGVDRQFPPTSTPVDWLNSPPNFVQRSEGKWTNSDVDLSEKWRTTTNPCPAGYHVMNYTDLTSLLNNYHELIFNSQGGPFAMMIDINYRDLVLFGGGYTKNSANSLETEFFAPGTWGLWVCGGVPHAGTSFLSESHGWVHQNFVEMTKGGVFAYEPIGGHLMIWNIANGTLMKEIFERGSMPVRCVEN